MTTIEKVFLDYSQDDLDQAYDQALWAPNINEMRNLAKTRSAAVRERHPHFECSYGPTADETIEILPTAQTGAPVVLFVHGGRWMAQPENAFIQFAETITAAGAHFAAARFVTLDPKPGNIRMPDMIDQLRRSVVWLYRNAASFGGDPEQIHLIGHSSGGHLASVLLTTDWTRFGVPATVFKSGTCVSGMYDLRPVLLSSRGDYVKLSAEEEDEFSAMRHLDRVRCPILVAYGDKESPEFQRHGRTFAPALKEAGHEASLFVIPSCNHFEGIASMTDPQSSLAKVMLKHLGLKQS
jgi:arylformamidase